MNVYIDKDQVLAKADLIISDLEEFGNQISKLLAVIENINSAWDGDDALSYINILKERYIVNLNEFLKVMNDYSDYLKNVPGAYELLDEIFSSKVIDV